MESQVPGGRISGTLAALPGTDDVLFRKLWPEHRLLFNGLHGVGDVIDETSARLVTAALRRRERLLVVLPDFASHRPALLFATGLIRHFLDTHNPPSVNVLPTGSILYFGMAVGIRDQLRRTSVAGLHMSLSDVFNQQDVSRGAMGPRSGATRLPSVVTVYAPADPVGVMRMYKPSWVAIDCGDVSSLAWLRPLLDEAMQNRIPVIAWSQNALSECVSEFRENGLTFVWPPRAQQAGNDQVTQVGDPDSVLSTPTVTSLSPVVIDGKLVGPFSAALRQAGHVLGRRSQNMSGQFVKDAITLHWRYLRSLEGLTVPLDFYETEATRFWGLRSFAQLRAACEHFRRTLEHGAQQAYTDLETVGVSLSEAEASLKAHGCAMWNALANLCMDDVVPGEARILTFSSESRKRLFLLALLAKHNITADDLRDLRTYVASLSELRQWTHRGHAALKDSDVESFLTPSEVLTWHPVVIGLPSPVVAPRLLCAFLLPNVDFMLYPHQRGSFMRRCAEWSERVSAHGDRVLETLGQLSETPIQTVALNYAKRISVGPLVEVNVDTSTKINTIAMGPLWQADDPIREVARLFETDDETVGGELLLTDQTNIGTTGVDEIPEDLWCAEATEVQFEQAWRVYFAPDDMINVVRVGSQGKELDERYVRSLNVGDRVLLIHGQARQSLYDLILSRVHRHPSIELHLAMIGRWQADLKTAFQQWNAGNKSNPTELLEYGARDLNGLLRRMRAQGSTLVSTLTLSFWLKGFVLCPLDPDDLARVADILGMNFVKQYHQRIVQAANRLRGLHRGLSLKLRRWLEDQAAGAGHRSDHEVIDDDLGLTFGDVRNSLMVLRVVAVKTASGPFLRSDLGRAQRSQ